MRNRLYIYILYCLGTDEEPVIYIREGCKGYGRGSRRKNILNSINMTVNKGEM